ncbi:MAG TPA: cytochrome c [Vicinamibacterales bacterium]|nr:cytochrome c [Vicinamibacterales bacterium]
MRFSAVFAFFAAFAFLVGAATAQEAPTGHAQQGKELYLKYSCYACHGYDGHGGAGARIVPLPLTLTRFTAFVRSPRRMPPYSEKVLTDAQAADLFAYIKSLPASPSADQIPLLKRIMDAKN